MVAKRRRFTLHGATALGLLASVCVALAACGEEGVTPDCPPVTLYDVGRLYADAGQGATDEELEELREKVEEERAAAVDAGCMTALGKAETE